MESIRTAIQNKEHVTLRDLLTKTDPFFGNGGVYLCLMLFSDWTSVMDDPVSASLIETAFREAGKQFGGAEQ